MHIHTIPYWSNYCCWATARRLDYYNFMFNTLEEKQSILCDFLWTDKSMFTWADVVKMHNVHYWSLKNLHTSRTLRHQICWLANVWCGIWETQIVEYDLLKGRSLPAPADKHSMWLVWRASFPKCLLDVVSTGQGSSHKASNVRLYVTTEFSQQIIGYGNPTEWPFDSEGLLSLGLHQDTGLNAWAYFSGWAEETHHSCLSHSYTCYALTCPGLNTVRQLIVHFHQW